eukprot:c17795_g2_i2.p1 GENE.c17795_g2_i2~~c17795_g2_i2.p1  ORF type:complete len:408 (+),score=140.18 c17795_g2_i2:19-1242(+)
MFIYRNSYCFTNKSIKLVRFLSTIKNKKTNVIGWGSNEFGQVGVSEVYLGSMEQKIAEFDDKIKGYVSQISCGFSHSVFLANKEILLSCGKGAFGRLGHGNDFDYFAPTQITSLVNTKIKKIFSGSLMSGFISENGELYVCGNGSWGTLGHGEFGYCYVPTLITKFQNSSSTEKVVDASAGGLHMLVLTEKGRVYGCGRGDNFRLASFDFSSRNTLVHIPYLDNKNIKSVYCTGFGSAALSHDGKVYVWGGNQNGELGLGHKEDQPVPHQIDSLNDEFITNISCGGMHMLLLSKSGKVFVQGSDEWGQLGLGNTTKKIISIPTQLNVIKDNLEVCFRMISCGGCHSIVVSGDQDVYVFGSNRYSQLGIEGKSVSSPQLLKFSPKFNGNKIIDISCGSAHTLCLMEEN